MSRENRLHRTQRNIASDGLMPECDADLASEFLIGAVSEPRRLNESLVRVWSEKAAAAELLFLE
jgi:hypothetical protein